MSATDKFRVELQSRNDLKKAVRVLEEELSQRTYIVGEAISIADISIFCAIAVLIEKYGEVEKTAFPSVVRWFLTVGSLPEVSAVVGDIHILSKRSTAIVGKTDGKYCRNRIRIKDLLNEGVEAIGNEVTVKGWVRTCRSAEKGQTLFVELNDGSTSRSVQLVLTAANTIGLESVANSGGVHASLSAKGIVVKSPAKGQSVEIIVAIVQVLGPVFGGDNGEIGAKNYPMSKKQHGLEFLREKVRLDNTRCN